MSRGRPVGEADADGMPVAAMAEFAYDQIDQARTKLT
jgi:hypothetical protein